MAFTYTGPSTDRGKVRLYIGDTEEQNYSLSDAEVDESLDQESNVYRAAVLAHEWLMARLANYITTSAGGQSHQLQQRYDQHEKLHKLLVKRAAGRSTMNAYAGGIDETRVEDSRDDTDYIQPHVRVGQHDRDYDTDDPTRGDC